MTNQYLILVAGGIGTRAKSAGPKQYQDLCGKPIIIHTLAKFLKYNTDLKIIIVVAEACLELGFQLAAEYFPYADITIASGGETRTQSVLKGLLCLRQIEGKGLVAIHDAVRPFVSTQTIASSFQIAETCGNAICAMPSKDSVRQILPTGQTHVLNRETIYQIQTPQVFNLETIIEAYSHLNAKTTYTDDASVYESYFINKNSNPIVLTEGSYANIKITTPEDFLIAEALFKAGY